MKPYLVVAVTSQSTVPLNVTLISVIVLAAKWVPLG
jgi:hypothetical protein